MAYLIRFLVATLMNDCRMDMFLLNGTMSVFRFRTIARLSEMLTQIGHSRPGILVLINDADWELEGTEQYILQENDAVLFVSTLHGG